MDKLLSFQAGLMDKEAVRGDQLAKILQVGSPATRKRILQLLSDIGSTAGRNAGSRRGLAELMGHTGKSVGREASKAGIGAGKPQWKELKDLISGLKGQAAGAEPWTSNGRKALQDLKLPAYIRSFNVPGLTD